MSTKSERLGGSSAFQAYTAPGPISGRGQAIAVLTGEPVAVTPPPVSPRVPIDEVDSNPYNPRPTPPAISDMADSIEQLGKILSALVVVTRDAFLAVYPEAEGKLKKTAKYVAIDGNRRLLGARQAGWEEVPISIDDELATDSDTLLQAILTADAQHEALDHLDAAAALKQYVASHGSQRAAARALGKSQSWISKKLAVLNLTADLQAKLRAGQLPIDVAAKAGGVPPEEQQAVVEEELAKLRAKAGSQESAVQSAPGPESDSGGITRPASAAASVAPASSQASAAGSDSGGIAPGPKAPPVPGARVPGRPDRGMPREGDSGGITRQEAGAAAEVSVSVSRGIGGDSAGITSGPGGREAQDEAAIIAYWLTHCAPDALASALVENLDHDTVMDVMQRAVELLRERGIK